jgi:hypothetical protein
MKTGIFTTLCCTILALCGAVAHGQDASRVPDPNPDAGSAVDASVHAGVDEQSTQQPQPSQQPHKRQQTTYSYWVFQPANRSSNQPLATRFQHEQAPKHLAQPKNDDDPSTLFDPLTRSETPFLDPLQRAQDTPFAITPAATTGPRDPQSLAFRGLLQIPNGENGAQPQGLKSFGPLPSPFPRNNGFSTSLPDKKADQSEKTFLPNPFSKRDVAGSSSLQPKSQKHTPKPVDRNKPAPLVDSKVAKQN